MKTLSYKIFIVSSLLTVATANMIAPTATFAAVSPPPIFPEGEVEPVVNENAENPDFAANNEAMKATLEKAGKFAKSMNEYSHMLIHNPDVNFEGIHINGHTELPGKIKQDQANARNNAKYWDTKLKITLLATLNDITTYDLTFQNYYDDLVRAANMGNKDVLKKGITDLQKDIQKNKQLATKLIEDLKMFKQHVGEDSRKFKENKETLHTVLNSQTGGLEDDEKRLQDTLDQINRAKKMETEGILLLSVPSIPTMIAGGAMLLASKKQLKALEPLLIQLGQTVDYKKTLNRVVTVAYNNVDEMHKAISESVDELEYMSTQWDDLDSQYEGVLKFIDKASTKDPAKSLNLLVKQLKNAKDSWATLHTDVSTLKEGIKELKLEPVQK